GLHAVGYTFFVGDIEIERLQTLRWILLAQLLQLLSIDVGGIDNRVFLEKPRDPRPADALSRAGYQRHLVFELQIHSETSVDLVLFKRKTEQEQRKREKVSTHSTLRFPIPGYG